MHEAIIDAQWDARIEPFLLQKFPNATSEQLRLAKSYAYGGAVIQDMGYYPLGGHFFSHLTHYVRSGDFVQALFEESSDINDYAFALGTLSHYCADIEGHSLGVNLAVPLLYPVLRRKYGDYMTWEDSPWAHVLTEFGFDTLEVVAGHVAPQKYHEWIGFRVPEPVLRRAFRKTYGLELTKQLLSTRLTLWSYRNLAGKFVPEMTEVAWAGRGKSLEERAKGLHHRSLFHLRLVDTEAGRFSRTKPGPGDKLTAMVFSIVPKFGPLNCFQFHTPTDQTDQLFADSLKATIGEYARRVKDAQFDLPDINLDTGRPTHPGDYRTCDQTYARLLHQLERTHFALITPALRENLLGFYSESTHDSLRKKHRRWRRVQKELKELRAAQPSGHSS
jgi:Zinc dependent phospholipase C